MAATTIPRIKKRTKPFKYAYSAAPSNRARADQVLPLHPSYRPRYDPYPSLIDSTTLSLYPRTNCTLLRPSAALNRPSNLRSTRTPHDCLIHLTSLAIPLYQAPPVGPLPWCQGGLAQA